MFRKPQELSKKQAVQILFLCLLNVFIWSTALKSAFVVGDVGKGVLCIAVLALVLIMDSPIIAALIRGEYDKK